MRLIDTVSVAGSVLISVAPGSVRVEIELAATPTSTMANIATGRFCASVARVNSASSDQAMPYTVSAATKLAVHWLALNLVRSDRLKRRQSSTSAVLAMITTPAQAIAANAGTQRLANSARMSSRAGRASAPDNRELAYSSS